VLSLPHGRFFLSYAASPDAGQIAVKELYRGRFWLGTAVHVLDAAGEERARTTLPADAYLCELQRESIGYWRLADGGDAVFIRAPLRGGEEREVARIPAPERWSCAIREGELVFPLRGADSGAGLWRKRENEPARPVLGSASRDQDPAWFPDGRSLVVSASQHQRLCRIDLATGARTFLLPDERGSQSRPAVSPDGRALAFLGSAPRSFGDVERRGTSLVHDLRLLDLTTGQSRLLVQDVCFSAPPVWWSPHELLLAKWLDDRCALFRYDLRTEQTTLLARRY
jgi:Tol biopolymer transport system component